MNDLISRQEAIDVIMGQPTEAHYPSWYAEQIKNLPSAQPEPCKDAVSRGVYEQTKWGRDMAIQQLSDLGYGLGEKIREREDDQQLNEAIKKYAELADYQKEEAEWWDQSLDEYSEVKRDDYLKWSREHKQVANWLMELKRLKASIPCEDAVIRADVVDMLEMYPFTEYSEYEAAMEAVKRLSPVTPKTEQPEIIRCQDCKNWDVVWWNDLTLDHHYCTLADKITEANFYCADGERKEDGQTR